jgi:hypothetical protein
MHRVGLHRNPMNQTPDDVLLHTAEPIFTIASCTTASICHCTSTGVVISTRATCGTLPSAIRSYASIREQIFYEFTWRIEARGRRLPLPWWVQQYFRHWVDFYDSGLFSSKQAAFSSNAFYRYWNMVGVKDHHQESLVGQAGEIEPVCDQYAVSFFLFDPTNPRKLHFPQFAGLDGNASFLNQDLEDGYLPVVMTTYGSPMGIEVQEKVIATTVGVDQRSMVLVRLKARLSGSNPVSAWLCLSVSPLGLSGFRRSDNGEIHASPTIYDSFWVRDSSVEGIACALSGDLNLAEEQFGRHYPSVFNFGYEDIGPVSSHGFFGGEHEENDYEWDSNGQALWTIGRFDRIRGTAARFGAGLFLAVSDRWSPMVTGQSQSIWFTTQRLERGTHW